MLSLMSSELKSIVSATLLLTLYRAMKRDANIVASWNFDRIIPCHGVSIEKCIRLNLDSHIVQDVIERGGNKAWRAAYQAFID